MDNSITENYGRRLLPQVINEAATLRPERIAYSFPIQDNPAFGFNDISNRRYANGVNRTAWWIENAFGRPVLGQFPTIGYIGQSIDFKSPYSSARANDIQMTCVMPC